MNKTKKRGNGNCCSNGVSNLNIKSAAGISGHLPEQELFLQAFEKPAQIYRLLRHRHSTSPIFLHRTLGYMKDRMSRNNKKRATFKVESLLKASFDKNESNSNKYLNIVFKGLFKSSTAKNNQWWSDGDVVCVETMLCNITKSKRKNSASYFQEILKQSSNIVFNPHENIGQYAGISIPLQAISPLGDQHIIYKLSFRIRTSTREDMEHQGESSAKRLKLGNKLYGCELNIYEQNAGVIPQGEYEVALREVSPSTHKSFSTKERSWETIPLANKALTVKFDAFKMYPKLRFRLNWSKNEISTTVNKKDLLKTATSESLLKGTLTANGNNANGGLCDLSTPQDLNSNSCEASNEQINHNNQSTATIVKRKEIPIIYNFLYSNNTRQQTECTQELICPWCGLDCLCLYALLKHLKLCHALFNFTYQPAGAGGARIDVTINDAYDGSPNDLEGSFNCSFARNCGPVRRVSVTNMLVCRPRRLKPGLDEFLALDEVKISNEPSYRLYHHTETCFPVHPKELDVDSENESYPLWLRQKTIQLIDEFSDVNEGEKELMKLWNFHVMKYGYVGNCHLPLAAEMFLDDYGLEIIRKNLYRNFILHLSSLYDYGLISPEIVFKTTQKLQSILSECLEGQQIMSKQNAAQLRHWLDVGMHKQVEQKLKLPAKYDTTTAANEKGTAAGAATSSCGRVGELPQLPTPKRMIRVAAKLATNTPPNGIPLDGRFKSTNCSSIASRDRRSVNNAKKVLFGGNKNQARKIAKRPSLGHNSQNNSSGKYSKSRSDSVGGSRRNSNSNGSGTNAPNWKGV